MSQRDNPLSNKDRSDINAALARLNQVLQDIEFLKSIGEDVTELELLRQHAINVLTETKKNYFPGMA